MDPLFHQTLRSLEDDRDAEPGLVGQLRPRYDAAPEAWSGHAHAEKLAMLEVGGAWLDAAGLIEDADHRDGPFRSR